MDIFRFVDPANTATVRLNLNNYPSGWWLARGFDLGRKQVEHVTISQPPWDGAALVAGWSPPVTMTVPLGLGAPESKLTPAQIRTAYDALRVELERLTNCIEFREPGDTQSYFIDTFKATVPTVHFGQNVPNPFKMGGSFGIVLEIVRQPKLRESGAGVMI